VTEILKNELFYRPGIVLHRQEFETLTLSLSIEMFGMAFASCLQI